MNSRNLIKVFSGFMSKGHERTVLAKKNILATFLIKGLNIGIGLILVPLALDYLNTTKYGIWITLSSVVGWFGFFDIGLGHGLRNKLAESLALGKHELGRIYVSTTYAILTLIVVSMLIIFFSINPFLQWDKILNVSSDITLNSELNKLAIIVFSFFCVSFVFKLITTILTADQRPAFASLFDLIGKIVALVIILILINNTEGSLLYLAIALSGSPVLVLIIVSLFFFTGKYKSFRPSWKYIDFSKGKSLFSLGLKFFVIQIAAVMLYSTNNIIISQILGPEEVTPYNITFKYFNTILMIFSIVVSPFWSAFTEAWVKRELFWIKNIIKKLIKIWVLLAVMGIVLLLLSNWVFEVWVGKYINIPFSLSIMVLAWVLINAWNSIFSQFLNGVGKIKLQMIVGLTAALVNIPLAVYLGRIYGINGIIMANLLVLSIGVWLYPLQYLRLIKERAKGIFNK